jgi:hypothetical protein
MAITNAAVFGGTISCLQACAFSKARNKGVNVLRCRWRQSVRAARKTQLATGWNSGSKTDSGAPRLRSAIRAGYCDAMCREAENC